MVSTSLEQALSQDFKIRTSPLYHLIKARVLFATGDKSKAREILEESQKLGDGSDYERASIAIELGKVIAALGDTSGAKKK